MSILHETAINPYEPGSRIVKAMNDYEIACGMVRLNLGDNVYRYLANVKHDGPYLKDGSSFIMILPVDSIIDFTITFEPQETGSMGVADE